MTNSIDKQKAPQDNEAIWNVHSRTLIYFTLFMFACSFTPFSRPYSVEERFLMWFGLFIWLFVSQFLFQIITFKTSHLKLQRGFFIKKKIPYQDIRLVKYTTLPEGAPFRLHKTDFLIYDALDISKRSPISEFGCSNQEVDVIRSLFQRHCPNAELVGDIKEQ